MDRTYTLTLTADEISLLEGALAACRDMDEENGNADCLAEVDAIDELLVKIVAQYMEDK